MLGNSENGFTLWQAPAISLPPEYDGRYDTTFDMRVAGLFVADEMLVSPVAVGDKYSLVRLKPVDMVRPEVLIDRFMSANFESPGSVLRFARRYGSMGVCHCNGISLTNPTVGELHSFCIRAKDEKGGVQYWDCQGEHLQFWVEMQGILRSVFHIFLKEKTNKPLLLDDFAGFHYSHPTGHNQDLTLPDSARMVHVLWELAEITVAPAIHKDDVKLRTYSDALFGRLIGAAVECLQRSKPLALCYECGKTFEYGETQVYCKKCSHSGAGGRVAQRKRRRKKSVVPTNG